MFTSLGLLSAFMAIISIDNGDWRSCFLWLFLCFIIDSFDGALARKFEVTKILPSMDGKSIDYVIDFATYCIIPAFFFYKAEMVDTHLMLPSLTVILLSSALYYGKKGMVENEEYFIGFPVLWNFVVFFQFFVFHNNLTLNFITVIIFGILHFVPIRFAYPSRAKKFFLLHLLVSAIGLIGALVVLYQYPKRIISMELCAVTGAVYFGLFALYDTFTKPMQQVEN